MLSMQPVTSTQLYGTHGGLRTRQPYYRAVLLTGHIISLVRPFIRYGLLLARKKTNSRPKYAASKTRKKLNH